MHLTRRRVRRFLASDEGIAVTEYGLVIALVALLLLAVVAMFGEGLRNWWNNRVNSFTQMAP